jgi:HemY protein
MKWLTSLVLWVLAAVAVAWALDNSGMVSLFVGGQRIDLSLNLAVIGLLALAWLLVRLSGIGAGLRMAAAKAKWARVQRAERGVVALLVDGISLHLAGRHGKAHAAASEALLNMNQQSSQDGMQLPRAASLRVLALWVMAESAQAMRKLSQAQQHLDDALAVDVRNDGAAAQEGVMLRSLRWALDVRDATLAQQRLRALPKAVSTRIQTWRSRLDLAQLQDQPMVALEAVRTLTKHGVFTGFASLSLQRSLAVKVIQSTADQSALQAFWKQLPADERDSVDVSLAWAQRLLDLSAADDAPDAASSTAQRVMQQLQPIWKRYDDLTAAQHVRLAMCVEPLVPHLAQEWVAQVETAQNQRTSDAVLQYLAAQTYLKRQLWGKAKPLLERAAKNLQHAELRRRAWVALADMAQQQGDPAAATAAWQAAAHVSKD